MSGLPLDLQLLDLAFRALEPRGRGLEVSAPPANLRIYSSAPAADDDLRERLELEARDEPRYRSREDREADDAGVRRWGEL